ncbi:unnamed protein product [Mesocestoides corti]|uniref:DUF5737 domain-containing protein n=1 Tax=Mesocestoides corti TaxID=53468 RepID=A0A0R3UFT8_MESCO|nr:unnamed protein product [Mesocestoides corti]
MPRYRSTSPCNSSYSSPRHQQPPLRRSIGLKPLFEELGYNYGFARADPEKYSSYCLVYRTLLSRLEETGLTCRIRADESEIRLTELEGPLGERDKVKIFANDVISYYKFNHRAKFVAICIDANRRKKTGFWFLCFEREGQLTAFCKYLNWLFGLDVDDSYDSLDEDRVSYVDRRSGSSQSFSLSQVGRFRHYEVPSKGRYFADSNDSGFTETDSGTYTSSTFTPPFPPGRSSYPRHPPRKPSSRRNFRKW